MRESEEWTLNAEKWASLAWLDGKSYPSDEMTEAWKKVLFNQFHDLAAGSGIGVIYKDAQKDFDVVRWRRTRFRRERWARSMRKINTEGAGVPVLVFNPLAWERSGDGERTVLEPRKASGAGCTIGTRCRFRRMPRHMRHVQGGVGDDRHRLMKCCNVVPGTRLRGFDGHRSYAGKRAVAWR